MTHKIVWGAIAATMITHSLIACLGLYLNYSFTPYISGDSNPIITKLTQIIYMVLELISFLTYYV